MFLFHPFLEGSGIASQRYPLTESALIKANGILFTHDRISEYASLMKLFCAYLGSHIGRITAEFRVQGPEMASSLCAATFDFGKANAFLTQCIRDQEDLKKAQFLADQSSDGQKEPSLDEDPQAKRTSMHAYWASLNDASEAVRVNLILYKTPTTETQCSQTLTTLQLMRVSQWVRQHPWSRSALETKTSCRTCI